MDGLQEGNSWGVWYAGKTVLWTTSRCADRFGFHSPAARSSADKKLRRAGFIPFTRLPGRKGENLWRAEEARRLI